MNIVSCIICENKFYSVHLQGKIQPWNCPYCNKDTDEKVQKDLNDLYRMIGFKAVDRLEERADRLLMLSQMYLKEQPEKVQMF
jgi:hypothetical protein